MLPEVKVLLSRSLSYKKMRRGGRNKAFLIIPAFLILLFTPPNLGHSQILQSNPDSIPFAPAVNYSVGHAPHALFSADLNSDGNDDIIVTNISDDDISILFGNGDGTFQTKFDISLGNGPHDVWGNDLNNDRYTDLVVGNRFDSTVSVLLNSGDGINYYRNDYQVGSTPGGIDIQDLDNDGDKDIVLVLDQPSNKLAILWNTGTGTFDSVTYYNLRNAPQDIVAFPCDSDSDFDLAISHNVEALVVLVAVNDGFGGFDSMTAYAAGACRMIKAARLDSNESMDFVVTNEQGNNVLVFRNNGNCSFAMAAYPVADHPRSVFVADFDLDGNMDLASEGVWSTFVTILRNAGNGIFERVEDLRVGHTPYFTWAEDFDNDMDPDLAVVNEADDSISILINLVNTKPNPFSLLSPSDAESSIASVSIAWQSALDPDPNDSVHYDLYLSRSIVFDPDSTDIINLSDTTFTGTLDLKRWHWKVKAYDKWGAVRWSNQTWSFYVYLCGDCNNDGVVDIGDVVYLINYLFKNGSPPVPFLSGDLNCDGVVDVGDVVYLINYLFKNGPHPCADCPLEHRNARLEKTPPPISPSPQMWRGRRP